MKKVLFFFAFSLILTSCATTNGCIGKGYGSATKVPENRSNVMVYRPIKKEPKAQTIVKNRTENKQGLRGDNGAKPPKPTKSNVE